MEPALLLNATYEPLSVVSWKKAITLVLLDKAEILEPQEREVRSATRSFTLPSVLRLYSRVKVPRRTIQFSRANVYRRDGYRCQYCEVKYPVSRLTFDHVVPRSRGGQTTWENIVTSCSECNRVKGDRTPKEAQMPLASTPKEPKWWPFSSGAWDYGDYNERWKTYMWI
jgi:5-methylcytosine-specific restriction endonuclease McrA